jgi:prephenate dehydrogenase
VIWAIPLGEYSHMLPKLKEHLKPTSLLVDVCSVKIIPEKLLQKYLPEHPNLLLTHPLFGPQSAAQTTAGHKLIITRETGSICNTVVQYCTDVLKLSLRRMSAEEHDKIMANVHVLTFFVARGLADIHIDRGPFITPSYQMIMDLVAFSDTHSQELFDTVQLGNPYAKSTRQQLLQSLQNIDTKLPQETSYDG